MAKHQHIQNPKIAQDIHYTNVVSGGGGGREGPRKADPAAHSNRLRGSIDQAVVDLGQNDRVGHLVSDIALEVIGETEALLTDRLDRLRNGIGIELRSVRDVDGKKHATMFIPESKLESFVKLIEAYSSEKRTPKGRPQNEPLVAGIDEIKTPILKSFWTDNDDLFPNDGEAIWWEVWLQVRVGDEEDAALIEFIEVIGESELNVGPNPLRFPERLVFHVHGTVDQWTAVFVPLLGRLAELRKAKEVATEFLELDRLMQNDLVEDLFTRLSVPPATAPAICVLDYGVNRGHKLLSPFLTVENQQCLNPQWTKVDNRVHHGTEMAGLAIFGDQLASLLATNDVPFTPHRLESVRILNSISPHENENTWGWVTLEGVAKAEQVAPDTQRVILLATTTDDQGRDHGNPTSWSAAIDQSASGGLDDTERLYIISAGNVRAVLNDSKYKYPDDNINMHRVEDPAQSWNALTVGACTELIQIRDPALEGHKALANAGELCPESRTSVSWDNQDWPFKPDIVMEGGNYSVSPNGTIHGTDDLALLTTSGDIISRPLSWMSDTSAASAQAAHMAAILQADYPTMWPETIRGLMIHSASWTESMVRQIPAVNQLQRQKRLRTFGYGKPDIDRARFTLNNRVALVHQGELQPFERVKKDGAWKTQTKDLHMHTLPWPTDALAALEGNSVKIRITLSYFIEPSPGRRGWTEKFRYQSHGLRFKLRGPTETQRAFRDRVSKDGWEDANSVRPSTADPIAWHLGTNLQSNGSVHSDWYETTGADLSRCDQIAIYPVNGWWRDRPHLNRFDSKARYSLIVTIETPDTSADLYTPIMNSIRQPVEIQIPSK